MQRHIKILLIYLIVALCNSTANAQIVNTTIPLPAPFECAQAGQMICQLELGKAYAFGSAEWGIEINYEQALFWLKQKPTEDNGYGPNVQALAIIDAIEKYQKANDIAAINQARDDFYPRHDKEQKSSIEPLEKKSELKPLDDVLSKEKYREWKMHLIRVTGIALFSLAFVCIVIWRSYCHRQYLRIIAQDFEKRHRVIDRVSRLWHFQSSRKIRVPVAIYLLWLLLLLFTNSFQFEGVFNMYRSDIEQFQKMAVLPPVFLAVAYWMMRWAVRKTGNGGHHD